MKVIRLFTVIIAIFFNIGFLHAKKDDLSYYNDFWNPQYHNKSLNYCMLYSKECGGAVADKFCKVMGYENSSKSIIAHNVGLANYLDACKKCSTHCKGWNCNGFKLIRCAGKLSHTPAQSYYFRSKTFVLPRFNKYRVAWCYADGNDCGKKVAFSFCRRMGYQKEIGYKKDPLIKATKDIGNQQLCFGDKCDAFSYITCYR
jgi:hypothetical protein